VGGALRCCGLGGCPWNCRCVAEGMGAAAGRSRAGGARCGGGSSSHVVREIAPILAQDGYSPTPVAHRFATAAALLASPHRPTTRRHHQVDSLQSHKIRNVADKLPDHLASTVTKRMRAAYHAESALAAEAQLEALAKELERTHPGAAGSLRECLAETLTVLRLDVSPTLARTLRSTNSIESMISHRPQSLDERGTGRTAPWPCAGAPPGCSRRASSSDASTATCTCPRSASRSMRTSPRKLSVPCVMMTT